MCGPFKYCAPPPPPPPIPKSEIPGPRVEATAPPPARPPMPTPFTLKSAKAPTKITVVNKDPTKFEVTKVGPSEVKVTPKVPTVAEIVRPVTEAHVGEFPTKTQTIIKQSMSGHKLGVHARPCIDVPTRDRNKLTTSAAPTHSPSPDMKHVAFQSTPPHPNYHPMSPHMAHGHVLHHHPNLAPAPIYPHGNPFLTYNQMAFQPSTPVSYAVDPNNGTYHRFSTTQTTTSFNTHDVFVPFEALDGFHLGRAGRHNHKHPVNTGRDTAQSIAGAGVGTGVGSIHTVKSKHEPVSPNTDTHTEIDTIKPSDSISNISSNPRAVKSSHYRPKPQTAHPAKAPSSNVQGVDNDSPKSEILAPPKSATAKTSASRKKQERGKEEQERERDKAKSSVPPKTSASKV